MSTANGNPLAGITFAPGEAPVRRTGAGRPSGAIRKAFLQSVAAYETGASVKGNNIDPKDSRTWPSWLVVANVPEATAKTVSQGFRSVAGSLSRASSVSVSTNDDGTQTVAMAAGPKRVKKTRKATATA